MPTATATTEIRSILTISDPSPPLPAPEPPTVPSMVEFSIASEPQGSEPGSAMPAVRPLPTIPPLPYAPSPTPGLETSILSTTLNTPSGPIVQYFNVTTRATPPPLSAVKFAPLPELAPRKRKNQTPLGIRARGQMMARRRAMLAYGGRLPDDHPLNQPPPVEEPSHSERYTWSEEDRPRQQPQPNGGTPGEEMDDPFLVLGRAVKGVWKKMSNRDIKSSASSSSPDTTSSSPSNAESNKTDSTLKKRRSFKRGRTSSNASEKSKPDEEEQDKEPPPPVPSLPTTSTTLSPNRRPSALRKSALVVADEADRAGAIAPLVHQPNENGGEVPPSLDSSANSSDCEDDNWQTATIRPEEERSVTTTEEEDGTTEDERDRSRTSSLTSSLSGLDEEVKTPTKASTKLGS